MLRHEHSVDAEVFAADKGNQSRWSHEGYTQKDPGRHERIFRIAFPSRGKITGNG